MHYATYYFPRPDYLIPAKRHYIIVLTIYVNETLNTIFSIAVHGEYHTVIQM